MRNLKLTVTYDGSNYSGWQIQTKQPHVKTIQDEIQKALKKILPEACSVIASGRTDAGVHALGQTINFFTSSCIPEKKIIPALNSLLPKDIVIIDSIEVNENFHARFDVEKKWYRYTIYNNKVPDVFIRRYSMFTSFKLDIEKMKKAAEYFKGKHNFKSFCSTGTSVNDFVRTIYFSELTKKNNLIIYDIIGNGFLYNMVRIIVGTLIEVGKGKIYPDEIPNIIKEKNRYKSGPTAKPHGLCLYKTYY